MHSLSNKKAEFFILTSVVIISVFYALSKYINPYAFIDTSKAVDGGEIFFFNNVKEKAIKTVEISAPSELEDNLEEYKNFVEGVAAKKGYTLTFDYVIHSTQVNVTMVLISEKYTLRAGFVIPRS